MGEIGIMKNVINEIAIMKNVINSLVKLRYSTCMNMGYLGPVKGGI